jgi:hypothetical protein
MVLTSNNFAETLFLEGLEAFGKFYSFYYGVCEDNIDSDNQNKIKVSCKALFGVGQIHEIPILPLITPMTNDLYIINPPAVGEEVVLIFKNGNLRYPRYIRSSQKSLGLVEINTVLNDNQLTPELLTAIIGKNILDVKQDSIKIIQNNLVIIADSESVQIYKKNSVTTSYNIQGDVLREQLETLKEQNIKLTKAVSDLTTALNTFMLASNPVLTAIAPPYAAIAAQASTQLITEKVKLTQIETTLNALDIEKNKSTSLINN